MIPVPATPIRIEDKSFIETHNDYEQYALVYSKTLAALYKDKKEDVSSKEQEGLDFDDIGRYVKILFDKKTIYRKCQARNGIKSVQIALGDRTRKELGVDQATDPKVTVSSSSFIWYYLRNSDKNVRITSWAGLIGLIFTVISAVITILSVFIDFPICF